jgi:molybdopterin converting factor small subunit
MQITVKLMGHLRSYAPPAAQAGRFPLDLPDGTSMSALFTALNFSPAQIHLVMRNGHRTTDFAEVLAKGDEVTLFPPVAGG